MQTIKELDELESEQEKHETVALDDPEFLETFSDKDIAGYAGWDDEAPEKQSPLLDEGEGQKLIEARSPSTKPGMRLLMGLGLSGAIALGASMLVGGFGSDNTKQAIPVANTELNPPLPADDCGPTCRKDKGRLLANQASSDLPNGAQPINLKPKSTATPKTVTAANTVALPRSLPQPVYISRPQPAPAPYFSRPAYVPQPSYRPPVQQSIQAFRAAPEDPASAIKRLSELGVVEDGNKSGGGGSAIASTPAYQSADYVSSDDKYPTVAASNVAGGGQPAVALNPSAQSTGNFTVEQGQEAKAELKTPIMWNADIDISGQSYVATLTKKFGSIPKGASVMLQLDPSQAGKQTGLLKLVIVSFSIKGVDYPVSGGIAVTAPDNGVVVAKKITPGGGIGFRDILGVFTGTAATALGGNGIQSSQNNLATQIEANAATNITNRLQQSVSSLGVNSRKEDRSYYRFEGSIKLVALQKVSF